MLKIYVGCPYQYWDLPDGSAFRNGEENEPDVRILSKDEALIRSVVGARAVMFVTRRDE